MDELQKNTLQSVVEWLEAYIDYHKDEPSLLPEGEPTDAQILANKLPVLKSLLKEEPKNPYITDEDQTLSGQDLKNALFSAAKFARESVNPNYKYCVVDSDLYEVYLTDDLERAMDAAHDKSRYDGGIWHVYQIKQCRDGYRCLDECWYSHGEYFEGDMKTFLHYDYVAHNAKIHKL